MRRIAIVILSIFANYIVLAVPARPVPFVVMQPDGTEMVLMLVGDEDFHYYITEDNVPVLQVYNGDGVSYYYAIVKNNVIIPGNVLAHSKEMRTLEENLFVQSQIESVFQCVELKKNAAKRSRMQMSPENRTGALGGVPFVGKKKGLVILVNFADVAMCDANSREEISRQFNEVGYVENGHIGSVHDYFYDQSFGQFDLTFDVVGPVSVSNAMLYYGKNDLVHGRNDINIGEMVTEACRLANREVDYSDYDWDGDGVVEQVFFVYAGYAESAGAASYTIWPHKFSLTGCESWGDANGPLYLDGVKIDEYACSSELSGRSGRMLNGIGVACHEFSHCLGLPDLYDVDYSGAFGMGCWDIMASGSYSGPTANGEVPYGYSAYERACLGWMNLLEIDGNAYCLLPPLNDIPVAYMICNPGCSDEFFVLENHQSYGWYGYLGGCNAPHGMMITHVDYESSAWDRNIVNTYPKHMRESIVPADNDYGTYITESRKYQVTEEEYAGDLFSGKNGAVRFSSESYIDCGGRLFNENVDGSYYLNMSVDNISEYDGMIAFTVGVNLEVPTDISVSRTGDGELNIQWSAVDNAEEYSVEILDVISIYPIRTEKRTIEGLYDTYISVEETDCEQTIVRVKARNEYVSSEWSGYIGINTDTNGIAGIGADDDSYVEYYTIDGMRINVPQKDGVYIRVENDIIRKVYIGQ